MVKVKVKSVVEQDTKTQRGSKGIIYSFLNLGAGCGCVVNLTFWPLYSWERTAVPTEQEAG